MTEGMFVPGENVLNSSKCLVLVIGCLLGVSACGPADPKVLAAKTLVDSARADSIARAQQDSINRTMPGYVIDSILPVEEELRRFRAAVGGDSATSFTGGSDSRDALVKRFVRAVSTSDVADLRAMVVKSREFADLYYLDSPYSHPPYRQSPATAWAMMQNPSGAGLTHLLKRFGSKSLTYLSHACEPKVLREGRTTRYTGCLVRVVEATGDTTTRRMFGSIVERGGVYKFLSYTNDL